MSSARSHRLLPMRPRDPGEEGRGSSPLELLFDLTFVIGVGAAAENLAEMTASGYPGRAVLGFVLAMFGILVGWINFSWFASAFETDDWGYRIATMIQMIGEVVLALGIPQTFHSIEIGSQVDVRVLVAGYVVMRIGMLTLWLRVARHSGEYRSVALRNVLAISALQVCWVIFATLRLSLLPTFVVIVVLGAMELLIPVFAQRGAAGTPWHPEHIADRYSAFAIITLGEGVVGTVASSRGALGGLTQLHWDTDAALVVVAGVAMTFAMWWTYFLTPFATLLAYRPARGYLFGYGHIPLLMAVAATGAGLHGAGIYLNGKSGLNPTEVIGSVAVPVGVYLLTVYGLYTLLFGIADRFHIVLLAATVVLFAAAIVGTAAGLAMPAGLLIITAAIVVSVVGAELVGYRHQDQMLQALSGRRSV
jgi:low temperature requirement protein LtrA